LIGGDRAALVEQKAIGQGEQAMIWDSVLATNSVLPHVNASLNLIACLLLCAGLWLIKRGRERAHKIAMLSCFGVSVAFLACYLAYHLQETSKPFPRDEYPQAAWAYYIVLFTHIPLAALVPILALVTITLGLRDRRAAHRKWAKITFPIWLYTSVTGVLIYLMLYVWFVPKVP
jgi:putative membrane protein